MVSARPFVPGETWDGVGPRSYWGADVPLGETEKHQLTPTVTVVGFSAAAIGSACLEATGQGVSVVYLPAGNYSLEATVAVPAGITLLGAGNATLLTCANLATIMFRAAGDRIRLTRLKLLGPDLTYNTTNDCRGLQVTGYQNARLDHCDLSGFSYAVLLEEEASAWVDHCRLDHNLRSGLGYGVMCSAGAYALVEDNEFSQNRISLASSGAIDYSTGVTGTYQLRPDIRPCHWEFLYNWVHGDDLSTQHQVPVDTHPSMNGSFVVENNRFEDLIYACGLRDGFGLVRGNRYHAFVSFNHAAPVANWIRTTTQNGIPVAGAMPHDIVIENNAYEDVPPYRITDGENLMIDGVLTRPFDRPPPGPVPRLVADPETGTLLVTAR